MQTRHYVRACNAEEQHACMYALRVARQVILQVSEGAARAVHLRDLLDDSTATDSGGILYFDAAHGIWLYEGRALLSKLRMHEASAPDGGDGGEQAQAIQAAIEAALDFAGRWNACQLIVAGCSRLVKCWRATMMARHPS